MNPPPEQELIELVRGMRTVLLTRDEDAANDAKALAELIAGDRPTWTHVSPQVVDKILQDIRAGEVPDYVQPSELFSQSELFALPPLPSTELTFKVLNYELVGIHHAQGGLGSKGAYLVALRKTPTSPLHVVVLKETHMGSPSEVFASEVMSKMGLCAPKLFPLTRKQFKDFTWKLRDARVTVDGTCGVLHSASAQEQGGMLMEFVRGTPLPECLGDEFDRSKGLLDDLGRTIALDIVLNCLDRTNVVWNHDGNPTNLLVGPTRLGVIDNTYNRIAEGELRTKHLDKIHQSSQTTAKLTVEGNEYIAAVGLFLTKSTAGRLVLSLQQLQQVVQAHHQTNIELTQIGLKVFKACQEDTQNKFEKSWGADKRQLIANSLQLDFLETGLGMLVV
ncbi:hypothetical protein BASA81_017556 [Batrachochytrium salamandrivorans]|nr:hypothetical protein BASA81_017556 [Batrachochytrium salamandrivorans]